MVDIVGMAVMGEQPLGQLPPYAGRLPCVDRLRLALEQNKKPSR